MFRSFYFLLAILGVLLVVVLVLLRRDLVREGRTGPRWKRKLLAAGLILLGMLGVTWDWSRSWEPGGGCVVPDEDAESLVPQECSAVREIPIPHGANLEETRQWNHLLSVWREAEEVGSSKRGDYPFTIKGRDRLLKELAVVAKDITTLQQADVLSSWETKLLDNELALLIERVQYKRPTEHRAAECYKTMHVVPAQASLARLTERLPLLKGLLCSKVRSAVAAKVLDTLKQDLAVLENDHLSKELPEDKKAKAQKISQKAKEYLKHINRVLQEEADMEVLAKKEEIEPLTPDERERAQALRKNAEATITKVKQLIE